MVYIVENNKIYLINNKKEILAFVTFPITGKNVVTIDHTYVHPSLRGQGVAASLLEKAYKKIKELNFKVIPECSYAVKWFEENKQYSDVLKKF